MPWSECFYAPMLNQCGKRHGRQHVRTRIYTVSVETESAADANAVAELLNELGYEANVFARNVGKRKVKPLRDTRMGRLILDAFTESDEHRAEDFYELVESHGYLASSVPPTLCTMHEQGDLIRVRRGVYVRAQS